MPMNSSQLRELDTHTLTVAKNYAMKALWDINADRNIQIAILNQFNRLSASVQEAKRGVPKGTFKPIIRTPERDACCTNEKRNISGGCDNCGDPSF